MFFKSAIGMVALLFLGCGVMNNPPENDAQGAITEGTLIKNLPITNIFSDTLQVSRELLPQNYVILHDKNETDRWMQQFQKAPSALQESIDYRKNYVLMYPIHDIQKCTLQEQIDTLSSPATIMITPVAGTCKAQETDYIRFYRIDKTISSIMIEAFGRQEVIHF